MTILINKQTGEKFDITDPNDIVLAKSEGFEETPTGDFLGATLSGISDIIPYSSQIKAGAKTIKQKLGLNEDNNTYEENLLNIQKERQKLKEENPKSTLLGNIVGGVAQTIVMPTTSIPRLAGLIGTQAYGIAKGKGLSETDAEKEAAYGAGLVGAIPGVVNTVKGTGKVIKDVYRKLITKTTPEEELGKAALDMLGAPKGTSLYLHEKSPKLAQTIVDEGLLENRFQAPSAIYKNAKDKSKTVKEGLEEIYSSMKKNKIDENDIKFNLQQKLNVLNKQSSNKELRGTVNYVEDFIKNDLKGEKIPIKTAWEAKSKHGELAFKNSKGFTEQPNSSAEEGEALIAQVYKNALEDSIHAEKGKTVLDQLKELNDRYTNLSTISNLAKSNIYTKKPSIISRLTIGSAIAAQYNPAAAGALFGLQSLGKAGFRSKGQFVKPKLQNVRKFNKLTVPLALQTKDQE